MCTSELCLAESLSQLLTSAVCRARFQCGERGCPAAFRTRTNLQRHRLRVHGLTGTAPAPPADPGPGTPHWEAPDDPLSNTPFR